MMYQHIMTLWSKPFMLHSVFKKYITFKYGILNTYCHARIHGLIHDGRLRACPSYLLGLMYVLKWLYAIRCLGFQSFGGCMKGAKPFLSPLVFLEFLCMKVASIVYLDFLDAHGGYYMVTVYIHLHSFFAIQFNSRKTTWEFHLSLPCALYICVCACISF
jgi:hypothetical protein